MVESKNKIVRRWIREHGAANFDFKNKDIIFHDGGLFCIEPRKIKIHKTKGLKKLNDGSYQVIFSRKASPSEVYEAKMWFEDIDDNIEYFQSMREMLNGLGYKTKPDYKSKPTAIIESTAAVISGYDVSKRNTSHCNPHNKTRKRSKINKRRNKKVFS